MLDLTAIGNNIHKLRARHGYTQDQLAELCGVTHQAVSRWECGAAAPSIDSLAELCALFDTPIEQLLCMGSPIDFTAQNIFDGHSRLYVVKAIIDGKADFDLANNLDIFMPQERLMLLKAVKDSKLHIDVSAILPHLTPVEQDYLLSDGKLRIRINRARQPK